MKVYLGADHRGFDLKQKVLQFLRSADFDVEDIGAHEKNETDDYPQFAERVAHLVSSTANSFGIVACGSGAGVEITANKIDGARATLGMSGEQVESARRDDNVNVLALASDFVDEEKAIEMVKAFLGTEYDRAARHERRLDQIKNIEKTN